MDAARRIGVDAVVQTLAAVFTRAMDVVLSRVERYTCFIVSLEFRLSFLFSLVWKMARNGRNLSPGSNTYPGTFPELSGIPRILVASSVCHFVFVRWERSISNHVGTMGDEFQALREEFIKLRTEYGNEEYRLG